MVRKRYKLAVLLAHLVDRPEPDASWGPDTYAKFFSAPTSLRSYMETASYGRAELTGEMFGPFHVMANAAPDGSWAYAQKMHEVVGKAVASGVSGYANYCVVFSDVTPPEAVWGWFGGRSCVFYQDPLGPIAKANLSVFAEFPFLSGGVDGPDRFDEMDCGCGTHPSSFTKWRFGWFTTPDVATVYHGDRPRRFTLTALCDALASTASMPAWLSDFPLVESLTNAGLSWARRDPLRRLRPEKVIGAPAVHTIQFPAGDPKTYFLFEARLKRDPYESPTVDVSSGIPEEGIVGYRIDESSWPPVHMAYEPFSAIGQDVTTAGKAWRLRIIDRLSNGFLIEVAG